jgi:hypothetical protein
MTISTYFEDDGADERACKPLTNSAMSWLLLLPAMATAIEGGVVGRMRWAGVATVGEMCRCLGRPHTRNDCGSNESCLNSPSSSRGLGAVCGLKPLLVLMIDLRLFMGLELAVTEDDGPLCGAPPA